MNYYALFYYVVDVADEAAALLTAFDVRVRSSPANWRTASGECHQVIGP